MGTLLPLNCLHLCLPGQGYTLTTVSYPSAWESLCPLQTHKADVKPDAFLTKHSMSARTDGQAQDYLNSKQEVIKPS